MIKCRGGVLQQPKGKEYLPFLGSLICTDFSTRLQIETPNEPPPPSVDNMTFVSERRRNFSVSPTGWMQWPCFGAALPVRIEAESGSGAGAGAAGSPRLPPSIHHVMSLRGHRPQQHHPRPFSLPGHPLHQLWLRYTCTCITHL